MSDQVIPAEAVEAAAKAVAARTLGLGKWEDMACLTQRAFLDDARAVLEAAAPYMLATNKPVKEVSTGTLIRKLLDESRTDG